MKQLEYTLRSTVEEQRRLKEAELHLSNNGTTETIKEKKSGWFWK